MSRCSIATIKDRLTVATEPSPLHVFKVTTTTETFLDCVFDTIDAKARIAAMDTNYIGTYTKHSNTLQVDEELRKAIY